MDYLSSTEKGATQKAFTEQFVRHYQMHVRPLRGDPQFQPLDEQMSVEGWERTLEANRINLMNYLRGRQHYHLILRESFIHALSPARGMWLRSALVMAQGFMAVPRVHVAQETLEGVQALMARETSEATYTLVKDIQDDGTINNPGTLREALEARMAIDAVICRAAQALKLCDGCATPGPCEADFSMMLKGR